MKFWRIPSPNISQMLGSCFADALKPATGIPDTQVQVPRKLFNVESLHGQFGQLYQKIFCVPD